MLRLLGLLLLQPIGAYWLRQREPSPPLGRHIQLRFWWPAGIQDRLTVINRLMWMGGRYNATVHFPGGMGARVTLWSAHSKVINESWSHYVDIPGACQGRTPFHKLQPLPHCTHITNREEDFLHLFEHGESCVNIERNLWEFPKLFPTMDSNTAAGSHDNPPELTDPTCDVLEAYSPEVKAAADYFLKRYAVQGDFAAMHIRRCDYKKVNAPCTAPEAVMHTVNGTAVQTWLVFTYAEPGYTARLRTALGLLGSSRRVLLEDDVVLNAQWPDDNYFTYQVTRRLMSMAKVKIDTQGCAEGKSMSLLGSVCGQ